MILYILMALGGVILFLLPIILSYFLLIHPTYDKKAQEFPLDANAENPAPYLSSFAVAGSLLRLDPKEKASFKVILFNKKGKPFKVASVTCNDPGSPCWVKLPKKAKGVAFAERNGAKKISFDMPLWKIFVFPLAYGGCSALGLFVAAFGIVSYAYVKAAASSNGGLSYSLETTPLFFIFVIAAGVIAYLIGLLCLLFNYMHINKKKEAK